MSPPPLSPFLSNLFISYADRVAALESTSVTPFLENEERKTLQVTITTLREENENLKSEIREMAGKLEAAEASREAFRLEVLCLNEVNTTQQDDINSLRAELVEAEDRHDRFVADSIVEMAALQATRTTSQGDSGTSHTRSKKGGERDESNEVHPAEVFNSQTARDQAANLEPVAPLELSAGKWTEKSTIDEEQNVERKVKGLLNRLTTEEFDSISDQIVEWANKSEVEKDARTLIHVVRLVFEKATDEAALSEVYARLCRKMVETISPNVRDDGIRNAEGKPITGGRLFLKYLLNRCQEDFERGWATKVASAPAAAAKSSGNAAVKNTAEAPSEVELYSDEYYIAQKVKRQGLGVIQFIGELYKVQMLTERIMHECIKKLLRNFDNPREEEIEGLCRLLTTVGRLLDNPKARAHMDIYFTIMKELGRCNNVAPHLQLMLQVSPRSTCKK
jgi:translation initiation factor 4G